MATVALSCCFNSIIPIVITASLADCYNSSRLIVIAAVG